MMLRKLHFAVIVSLLLLPTMAIAAEKKPNAPDVKAAPLVTSRSGDLPIILSAPHGGRNVVPGVPLRQGKGVSHFQSKSDSATDRLTEELADAIAQKTIC